LSLESDVVKRYNQLKANRTNWEPGWAEISEQVIGRRPNFSYAQPQINGGRQLKNQIFDGTGMQSAQLFTSVVSSLLTNPATKWFMLSTANPALMQDKEVALWVEEAQEHLMFVLNRAQAAFQPQMHEMYTDLINYGTGAISILNDPLDGLYLRSHNLSEMFLDEDSRGRIDTTYRRFEMTPRQVEQEYPGKSKTALKMIDGKDDTKLEIIQALQPNTEFGSGGLGDKPVASIHVLNKGKGELLRKGGFEEMPTLTPRWEKESGEVYGRGPGWQALPDCKMANLMSRTMLKAGQMAVDPPAIVNERAAISTLRLHAGGVTTVRDDGSGLPPVSFLDNRMRFNIGADLIRARQVMIERSYHADILEVFRQPNMTATQVLQLVQQVERILSPVLGRQQNELLEPLINRAFVIESRAGRMPEPPQILLEGNNGEITVEYQSPVARAQKSQELEALSGYTGRIFEMAQVAPQVLDLLNLDEIGRMMNDLSSVSEKTMNTPDQVAEIRAARAEREEREQALQQGLAMAEAAGKLPQESEETVQ